MGFRESLTTEDIQEIRIILRSKGLGKAAGREGRMVAELWSVSCLRTAFRITKRRSRHIGLKAVHKELRGNPAVWSPGSKQAKKKKDLEERLGVAKSCKERSLVRWVR